MKNRVLKSTVALMLVLVACIGFIPAAHADCSCNCPACRAQRNQGYQYYEDVVVGYNLVLYRTQENAEPHYRNFRPYSINKNYQAFGARQSYGEYHYTKYVTADELSRATVYPAGSWVPNDDCHVGGYVKDDSAYYLNQYGDKNVWFVESVVTQRVCR